MDIRSLEVEIVSINKKFKTVRSLFRFFSGLSFAFILLCCWGFSGPEGAAAGDGGVSIRLAVGWAAAVLSAICIPASFFFQTAIRKGKQYLLSKIAQYDKMCNSRDFHTIKAVIFDLDGVIIDSEPVYLGMLYDYLTENSIPVQRGQLDFSVGGSSKDVYAKVETLCQGKLTTADMRNYLLESAKIIGEGYREMLNPNVAALMEYLKENSFRIALASSSSMHIIDTVLDVCGLRGYFEVVVSGEIFRESKPHPEIYIHTLELLRLRSEDCLVVEDSVYGIEAAVNAGIRVIAKKDHRFGIDQSKADYYVDDLLEIKGVLEALNK